MMQDEWVDEDDYWVEEDSEEGKMLLKSDIREKKFKELDPGPKRHPGLTYDPLRPEKNVPTRKYLMAKDKANFYANLTPQQRSLVDASEEQAKDTGFFETLPIGAGRYADKMMSGVADISDIIAGKIAGKDSFPYDLSRQKRSEEQFEKDLIYGELSEANPVSTFIGEALPAAALTSTGMLTRGVSPLIGETTKAPLRGFAASKEQVLKPALKEAAIGGAEGTAHYDDTALSGIITGGAGSLGANYLGTKLGGIRERTPDSVKKIIADAEAVAPGIYIPPGTRAGIESRQQLDNTLKVSTHSVDVAAPIYQKSYEAQNRAISEEIGDKVDLFSDEFFTRNQNRIGSDLDSLVSKTNAKIKDSHVDDIVSIAKKFRTATGGDKMPHVLKQYAQKINRMNKEDIPLKGKQYQQDIIDLRTLIDGQSDPAGSLPLKNVAEDITSLYKDIVRSSMTEGTPLIKQWDITNRQYALLKGTERARAKGNTNMSGLSTQAGYIDPVNIKAEFDSSPAVNALSKMKGHTDDTLKATLTTGSDLANILKGTIDPMRGLRDIMSHAPVVKDPTIASMMSGEGYIKGLLPLLDTKGKRGRTRELIHKFGPKALLGLDADVEGKTGALWDMLYGDEEGSN